MQHCYGILGFIIYNIDVDECKCGEKVFNLTPAGFQLDIYDTCKS